MLSWRPYADRALLMVSFPPVREAEAMRAALSAQQEEAAEQAAALWAAGSDSLPELLAAIAPAAAGGCQLCSANHSLHGSELET